MAAGGLGEVQRLLWRLVTAPEGVAQGLRDEGDPEGRALGAVLRGDARLGAPERLSVYANAYFYRIRDALREDFGAVHAALGEAAFHNLVTAYLIAHPPTHPSLRYAGRHLAEFLAAAPQALPYRDRAPFAADLAALEWALLGAFDAPDAPVLPREALAAMAPDRWGALRFSFTPSLQIVEAAWPVHAIREAHDRGGKAAAEGFSSPGGGGEGAWSAGGIGPAGLAREGAAVVLRVWRKRERVYYRPMSAGEHAALVLLAGGATFGDLCAAVADDTGEGAAPREALALLERWLADELLTGVLA